ncbi:GPI anchor biosynthesis protein [Malassezia pachydermatis]
MQPRAAARSRRPALYVHAYSSQPTFRVLILSDPQIIGTHTYEHFSPLMTEVASAFSDQYLRKVWLAVTRQGLGASLLRSPRSADLLVFLGDMTDRGRWYTDKAAWTALQTRWTQLFSGASLGQTTEARPVRSRSTSTIPAVVVPGNHDIGLPDAQTGQPVPANREAAAWFQQTYAPVVDDQYVWASHGTPSWNARIPIAVGASDHSTHELVLINAMDLVSMEPLMMPALTSNDTSFVVAKAHAPQTTRMVDLLASETTSIPRILFSHVPLARAASEHSCDVPWRTAIHGVRRESQRAHVPGGDILQGGDAQRTYQNLVGQAVSQYVLDAIQPALVFSGDDHDHCEAIHYRHRPASSVHVAGFDAQDVPELTVKSMSMLEGVQRPGYAWLELGMEGTQPTLQYRPCLLPNQVWLWLGMYVPCLLLTLCLIVLAPAWVPKSSATLLPHHYAATSSTRQVSIFVRSTSILGLLRRVGRDTAMVGVIPLLLWLSLQS